MHAHRAEPSFSVRRAAEECGERVALILDGAPIRFDALAADALRIATELRARGVGEGTRVALRATTDRHSLAALYALLELGATIIFLHPRLTESERTDLIACAEPSVCILDGVIAPGPRPGAREHAHSPEELPLAVMFTSGTTGQSKGAVLTRRAFVASARASAENIGWRDEDRWLLCMPVAHVGGLSVITRCLLARRTVVVSAWSGVEPLRTARTIEDQRVTIASLVPTQLAKILELEDWQPPASLRALLLGGAPTSPLLLRRARALGLPVLTTYGMTEACSQITTQPYASPIAIDQGVGVAIAGTEIRIGAGEEIWVRGPTMFSGYLGLGSPFDDEGWFKTGDLGRIGDDGQLHLLSRRTDLIVTGGENVYPLEVERTLEGRGGIRDVCVFGMPDEVWGQIVCAVIVPEDPEETSLERLAGVFSDRLAPHKRPRRVAIVPTLTTNATGKVDRRETATMASSQLVDVPRR